MSVYFDTQGVPALQAGRPTSVQAEPRQAFCSKDLCAGVPFPPHTALRALQSPSHAKIILRVRDMAPPLTPAKWPAGSVRQNCSASGVFGRGLVACWECPQERTPQLRPRVWHSHLAVPCSWEHKTRHVARATSRLSPPTGIFGRGLVACWECPQERTPQLRPRVFHSHSDVVISHMHTGDRQYACWRPRRGTCRALGSTRHVM